MLVSLFFFQFYEYSNVILNIGSNKKQDFVIEDSEDEVVTEKMKNNNKGMKQKDTICRLRHITTITHTIKDIDKSDCNKSDTDTSAVHLEQIDDDNQSEPEIIDNEFQQYGDWTEESKRYCQQEKDEKKYTRLIPWKMK
ncbi:hypothetical protein RFI_35898 [Reticulomyxa filosa]|uniref:Uncharacterized protein n=1 Tax=Reticulomyxa filosa TaxID=46433 RepID=X6LK78_RETFI|nr:hypothetical protein RFI_35898 [Reticulomyxa filosa]|eukprot:ETO01542.1 hypothetical protein RFI_35898 [Reticulomyxa filosa]